MTSQKEKQILVTQISEDQKKIDSYIKENINCRKCDEEHNHLEKCGDSETIPCNAYGQIKMHGYGPRLAGVNPKYLRLDLVDRDFEKIWTFLLTHMNLRPPNLILSINGGNKNMVPMTKRLESAFKQGIIKVSSCTSTWVITQGFQCGVAKLVGDAAKEYLMIGDMENDFAALGITTWGSVCNRQDLLNKKNGKYMDGLYVANYHFNPHPEKGEDSLDPNHTHFLLCDDGSDRMFGREMEYRAEFEAFVAYKVSKSQFGSACPVVQLVIEGGLKTIHIARGALALNTPIVVVKGSGRAADLICTIKTTITKDMKRFHAIPIIRAHVERMRKRCKWFWSEEESNTTIDQLYDMATKFRDLVHVFNIDSGMQELDKALLHAVFRSSNNVSQQTQLNLALNLNRCDVAAQEFFSDKNKNNLKNVDLNIAMERALSENLVDFVELFIDQGISMRSFLTKERLSQLYINAITVKHGRLEDHFFSEMLNTYKIQHNLNRKFRKEKEEDKTLKYIGRFVVHLTRYELTNLYNYPDVIDDTKKETPGSPEQNPFQEVLIEECDVHKKELTKYYTFPPRNEKGERVYTEQDLLLWAVLLNRFQLAKIFWKYGKDHIGSALVMICIIRRLEKEAFKKGETELSEQFAENAEFFEAAASKILSIAYVRDNQLAHIILRRALPYWGSQTCLILASKNNCMDFIYTTACQTKLNRIWIGGMSVTTPMWKIIFNIPFALFAIRLIFPKVEPTDIVSTPKEEKKSGNIEDISYARVSRNVQNELDQLKFQESSYYTRTKEKILSRRNIQGKQLKRLNVNDYIEAISEFYTAPLTKFAINIMSYIFFLAIFTYFVMVDLKDLSEAGQPSVSEIIVWVWFATFIIEEIREIFAFEHGSIQFKILQWFSSTWNIIDVCIIVLAIVALTLRLTLHEANFEYARNLLALVLSLYYIRFMQFYSAHRNIGPKVIMIRRMLNDLLFFICIYGLFIMAYGTLAQSLLYPNSPPSWKLLKNIFYHPYWQTYGELNLELVEGSPNCTADDLTCGRSNHLVIACFALFMLFSNVLLLNLLIAMFGYSFETVQSTSGKVWSYYRFVLVQEFFDRPCLPPPLIIIPICLRICRNICMQLKSKITSNNQTLCNHGFKVSLKRRTNEFITGFEQRCMQIYLQLESRKSESVHCSEIVKDEGTSMQEETLDVAIQEFLEYPDHTTDGISGDSSTQCQSEDVNPSKGTEDLTAEVMHLRQQVFGLEGKLINQSKQMDRVIQLLTK